MDYRTCSDEELVRMQKNIEIDIKHLHLNPDSESNKYAIKNNEQKLYSIEREFKRRYT